MSNLNQTRMTKSERREQAREKARLAREEQQKQERKRRLIIQGSIVLAVIAVLAIIGLVIAQSVKPAGPGPKNMASGGIVFEGPELSVRSTPAINEGDQLVAQTVDRESVPLDVVVYVDYLCPHCGVFEQEAGAMLEQWVASGQATVQVYPLNFQDTYSKGTRYSTRAANAVACVAEQQPAATWKFHSALLSADIQPAQNTTGLTNERLLEVAEESGARVTSELKTCVNQVPFADFFVNTTRQALSGPIVGLADGVVLSDGRGGMQDADAPQHITGTPAVMVNGMQAPTTVNELEQFMLKLFAELSSESTEVDEGADGDAGGAGSGDSGESGDSDKE